VRVTKLIWSLGVVAPLVVACSSPADPLGLARRKSIAPTLPSATTAEVDASVPDGAAPTSPAPAADASVAEAAAPDAAVVSQISDLAYTVVANGFGPAEKDTSNGEDAANDGAPIKLEGVVYPKGLGVHAGSEITLALNAQYTTFLADVGVDDEVADRGSIVFQVLADDIVVFDSGTMTGATPTKTVNVSVAGKQQLKLVVTDAGDGIASDHGDWAGARLVK
jgi:hypothetical protein